MPSPLESYLDSKYLASELSLCTGAAVGGRNVGREERSELASLGLSLGLGQVSRGKKKKPEVALCNHEDHTSVIVLNVLESEEKL